MFISKFLRVLGFLAVLTAAGFCQANPLYQVSLLPNVDFSPTAMNNAGQITGFAGTGQGTVHAVLYADGTLTDLGALFGRESYADAINDAGAITGTVLAASGEEHAFLYQHGSVIDLGAGTAGYGINARGDVVGSQQTVDGSRGFVFSGGTLTGLANAGGWNHGVALDINDHGVIIGASATGAIDDASSRLPWLYRHDAFVDLAASNVGGAIAVNNRGQVAGYGTGPDGATHALLYDRGVTTDLGGFGDGELDIHGLNVHGTLVGTAFEEEAGLIPFISVDNALVDLNTLVDPVLGWHLSAAYANNDLGQIVGYGCQGDACGLVRLDLTSAVPEPASAWLLLAGLTTLAGLRRKCLAILAGAACMAPLLTHANPLYTVSALPDGFIGNDINNAGQMAGQFLTNTGFKAALYGDNGVIQLAIPNDHVSIAMAINEAGAVTGFSSSVTSTGYAFLYQDGALTLLADGTTGMGINDKGVVVGEGPSTTTMGSTGFMYKNGTLTELGTLSAGNRAFAVDINNRGQVVGESRTGPSAQAPSLPFLYQHGTLQALDTLFDGGMNGAQAINDAGLIAGFSTAPDGTQHAVLYDHGVARDAGTFGANLLEVTGINEQGVFVGDSYRALTSRRFGFIYLEGMLTELSTLIDPAEGWVIEQALGINDLGQIAAIGCRTDYGYCNGVRLDLTSAVPEPRHAVLLLPGLALVALAQRRRGGRRARRASAVGLKIGAHA